MYSEIDYERAVISPEYKLICRGDMRNITDHVMTQRFPGSASTFQLYGMVHDKEEKTNLADSPEHAAVLEDLKQRCAFR